MSLFFNYDNSVCSKGFSPVFFPYDPSVSSLKELLMYELSQFSYYSVKLRELDYDTEKINDKIVNFISLIVVNLDFRKEQLLSVIKNIYDEVKKAETEYKNVCAEKNIEPLVLKGEKLSFDTKQEGYEALNFGEKELIRKNTVFSKNKKRISDIATMLVSNACLCITETENFGRTTCEVKEKIPEILYTVNYSDMSDDELKNKLTEFSVTNMRIMKDLYSIISEKYGEAETVEVDLSIKKGKCILVSGHYYRNLEMLLELAKNEDINVYTHNEMIFAHCYSNLNKYKNLAGHYQRSLNNPQFDFAAFPGAVLITKNSHTNFDSIRGRIFTPDNNPAYGISKVSENDFSPLIEAAKEEKGFAKDVKIGKISVGYNKNEVMKKLSDLIRDFRENRYRHLFFADLINYSSSQNNYFSRFFEILPDDCYVISFSYNRFQKKNVWNINVSYDMALTYDILDKLNEFPEIFEKTTFFITQCRLQTISHSMNFKNYGIKNVFLGECCPTVISPTLIEGLEDLFGINQISKSARNDTDKILGSKTD